MELNDLMEILVPVAVSLLGLLLLTVSERSKGRVLRLSEALLERDLESAAGGDDERLPTMLERIRLFLSAGKMVRLVALVLFLPAVCLLTDQVLDWVTGRLGAEGLVRGEHAFLALVGRDVVALGLALVVPLLAAWGCMRGARRSPMDLEEEEAEWLMDPEASIPAWVAAGGHLWERMQEGLDKVLAPLKLDRPVAQLFEEEEQLYLEIETVRQRSERRAAPEAAAAAPVPTERTEDDMLRAIKRLDQTLVREVMRPINQVIAVRFREYTVSQFIELARRTGFTRIPCYDQQITNLRGYLNIYDVLELREQGREEIPEELINEALFVPEVSRVDRLLQEMITKKQQVAIAFDEFGGSSGWVTREDILEEIIGEVEDEYDRPRKKLLPLADGYLVDPAVDLDDLREEVGLDLPKKNCDTIAGYIYGRLGRAPHRGEQVEEKGWIIEVASVHHHRIRRIKLYPPAPEEEEE